MIKHWSILSDALKLKEGPGTLIDVLLLNISSSYALTSNFTEARKYVELALAGCGNNCSDYIIVTANFNLGLISFLTKELPEAEIYFKKSYSLAKKINEGRYQLDNVHFLSQLYIQKLQLAKAIEYLNEAEKLIENGLPYNIEKIKIYKLFFEVYGRMSDFEKTAWYQQKYIQLKDSIYDQELTTNLMKIEADYLERENQARIASQELVLVLKEAVIERQQLLNIFIGSTAVMLILLVAVLVRSNRQKRRNNQKLEESVRERTRELQENNKALLTTRHDNDMFVAKASRDMRGVVASIKGLCTAGLNDIAAPDARQYLDEVNAMSDQLVLELQRLQDAVSLV